METTVQDSTLADGLWQYSPIPDGSFRLINLRPGSGNEPIHIELTTVSFEEAGDTFEALSYAWGKEAPTMPLYIDGTGHDSRFNVSPTLHAALSRIRYEDKVRKLWVDAICINQSDNQEKNEQVPHMGWIYSKAASVLAWLGEEDDETELGIRCLLLLNNLMDKHDLGDLSSSQDTLDDTIISALNKLFQRSWFDRLWVVQEVLLAQRLLIKVGRYGTLWELWNNAVFWLNRFGSGRGIDYHNFYHLHNIWVYRKEDGESKLLFLLWNTRDRKASNPRDKVFGLLGLASATGGVRINYDKSTAEVYIETAKLLMAESKTLEVLDAAAGRSPYPSWVPDWASESTYVAHHWINLDGSPRYKASLNSRYEPDLNDPNSDRLVLQGKKISCISRLVHKNGNIMQGTLTDSLGALSASLDLSVSYIPTGELMTEALKQTLAWDMLPSSGRGDSRHLHQFSMHSRVAEGRVARTAEIQQQLDDEVSSWIRSATVGWTLFVSDDGYIGLAYQYAKPGDIICLLLGGFLPFVLRPKDEYFELVSTCYLHGFMDGEGLAGIDLDSFDFEHFTLV